jgi:hypothetical protein
MRSMLVWLVVCIGAFCAVTGTAQKAPPATADELACRPAELFITDDESPLFELQADVTIALNAAAVTGSTPVDGAFWSEGLQRTTFEHARQFHLCVVDELTLYNTAEALRRQFDQQAVLTFVYLPANAAETTAITITVPGIDVAPFNDAFVADSAAHHRLLGGSVTTTDRTLILVAGKSDLDIARRLVADAGGCWNDATIAYGRREFVNQALSQ